MKEHRIHQIFEVSIVLKGLDALIESLSGITLAFVSNSNITSLINLLTHGELAEDPHDFVATHLQTWAQHFSFSTKTFYALYLVSHGAVKIFIVVGLLMKKRWSYPVSLVVLGLFIIYQIYIFSSTHGIGLIILTAFDIFVMALIWHEYKLVKENLPIA